MKTSTSMAKFSVFFSRGNFPCLDKTFHAMPHENLDPRLCHGCRPVRFAGLARSLWSQRCRAQDRVWTKKNGWKICLARKFLKSNVSHFFDRRLEFSWLASLSTHPSCRHQCGTWRDVDFGKEQIKNAFQRTTIVCSIYSSTKSAYFACNYRACWIFIFTFCEVLFVDCQIWYLETFSLIWSKRNMHQEKFTTKPTVFSPQNL